MTWKEIEPNARKIKELLLDICGDIDEFKHDLLPNKPSDIKYASGLIKQETFDIVVCGEVKKGKSSFVNAIIGEDLLPTDTQVATSQVFRIVNSDEKRFFLVFVDGSKTEISQDELKTYGSQVHIDNNGDIIFERVLDYILVEYPLTFLPKSIAIVDTPGIGALYATHEQITKQYLKKASAVIFITDPQNPITDPEVKFVESALEITDQIMFVMTKIDDYKEAEITTMIHRNKEILSRFSKQVYKGEIGIYPISSRLLMDAAKEESELRNALFEVSQFEEIRNELLYLIHSTVCLSRNVYAFNVLNSYNSSVMNSVAEQTKVLSSPDTSQELIAKKGELKDSFIKDWGKDGEKQRQIVSKINDQITSFRNRLTTSFDVTGEVSSLFAKEIEGLTLDVAENYVEQLPARLVEALEVNQKKIYNECYNGITQILSEYTKNLSDQISSSYDDKSLVVNKIEPCEIHKPNFMEHFNQIRSGYYSVLFIVNMLPKVLIPGSSWVLYSIAGIIGLIAGRNTQLNRIKRDLHTYLRDNLVKLRTSFCVVPISEEDPRSALTKAEQDLKLVAEKVLKQIYNEQKASVENNLEILNAQITANDDKRKDTLKSLSKLRTDWAVIYNKLVEAKALLQQMETSINEQ